MKYLALVLFGLIAFNLTGCTKGCNSSIGCDIEKTVVSGVGPAIASGLQCSNEPAIEASLNSIIGKLNLCSTPVASTKPKLPQPICSLLVNLVVNGVASVSIPSAWGCTAANAKGLLENVIVTACTNL